MLHRILYFFFFPSSPQSKTVCHTNYVQECSTIQQQSCRTEYKTDCATNYEEECVTLLDEKCSAVYEDKCHVELGKVLSNSHNLLITQITNYQ